MLMPPQASSSTKHMQVLEHFIAGKTDLFSGAEDYPLQPLEDDCNLLSSLLDKCLEIEIGSKLFKKYNRLRALSDSASRLSAASDDEASKLLADKMSKELIDMPLEEALPVLRAFGHYLNLTSIAEMHHSVRSTRMDGMHIHTSDEIYLHLLESGITKEKLYNSVVQQHVEIVLTAHPTQVNRRTLQHKFTRIASLLAAKDNDRMTEVEQARNIEDIRREITALWQTDEIRRRKPTPLDEARGGLHIVEQSLWAAVPEHLRRMDAALRKHTGRELPIDATPLRFGSWMGGDRDGNPNVTAKVTHDVACLARWMAADLYLKEVDKLRFELSMSHANDEVWRLARGVAAKYGEESGVAGNNPAVNAAVLGKGPPSIKHINTSGGSDDGISGVLQGDSPAAFSAPAAADTAALLRSASFATDKQQAAGLMRRGSSLEGKLADGSMSPPAEGVLWSPNDDTSGRSSFEGSSHGVSPNGNASGTTVAARISAVTTTVTPNPTAATTPVQANPGTSEHLLAAIASLNRSRADTDRIKRRGMQAARYHKSSIDNLLHPRAAGAAPYRILLGDVRSKLVNTRRRMEDLLGGQLPDDNAEWYETEEELLAPLVASYLSLWECGGGVIADGRLLDLIRRLYCFGLSLMKLDLRQESTRHTDALDEVTRHLDLGSYAEWDEEERIAWLVQELEGKRPLIPPNMPFTPEAQEVIDTFKVAAQLGRQCLSAYVISMATRASDVLAVELLQREAYLLAKADEGVHASSSSLPPQHLTLRVAPLFETLSDLNAAAGIMKRLYALPWYRKQLEEVHGGHQEIMLGYSDSGKDAGRLAAAWALYRSQEELVAVSKEAGIKLTLFHGRGGTIGRGGGPMLMAIQSQPPGSVQGSLRITEQGEMVQAKFGVPAVAQRQLDIYNNAVLLATLDPPKPPKDVSWRQIMDDMSQFSCAAYRSIVFEDPVFIRYFQHATPQEELANLNIGSRPTRRKAGADVTTLRAIPWIFAWTQTRMILPAWLGVADGINAVVKDGNRSILRDMYEHWPFFQSVIDLIEMVLTKADMRIATMYDLHLVTDPEEKAMGECLRQRYNETVAAILSITGHARLGDNNPTLRNLIAMRNPHVDPVNVIQVEILRRLRLDMDNTQLRDALLLSIQSIAAGMRNTG